MFSDRYGANYGSDKRVTIFSQELEYDSETEYEDTIVKVLDFDESTYEKAYEVDMGAGADWPFVALQILESVAPASLIATVFFFGERIENSFDAWHRMARKIVGLTPKHAFLDRNGAAVLALSKLTEAHSASTFELLAYQWIDSNMAFPRDSDLAEKSMELIASLNEIAPADSQFGQGLHGLPQHLFKIRADNVVFLVRVLSTDVFIRVIKSD